MTSHANRLRILVALAALKHKPTEQTFLGYVLDLRALFPCGPTTGREVYWREYAAKLEKDYTALKIRFEEKEILSGTLESFVSANGGEISGKPGGSDESSKKKAKKKYAADRTGDHSGRRDVLLEADFEKLCRDEDLSCSGEPGRLFASLETFYRLSACHGEPGFPSKHFLSATRRVLDAISVIFGCNAGTKLNANHMQTINTALRLLIERSFPIVLACGVDPQGRTDAFASLLNSFLCSVLTPLVRTFYVLSTQHLQSLVSPELEGSSGTPALLDYRPGLLTLFRSILSCVDLNLSPLGRCNEPPDEMEDTAENYRLSLSLLYHSLILDTLRHLQDIVRQTVIETENQKSSKHGRVMRLSIKNTIWYLCSALHIVIGLEVKNAAAIVTTTVSSSGFIDAQTTRLKLLKATTLDSFVEFLSRLDKTRRMHATKRLSALELDVASKTSGTDSLSDAPPIPSETQGVKRQAQWRVACTVYDAHRYLRDTGFDSGIDAFILGEGLILLDGMEYRMVMRVVETYSSTK